MQTCDAISIAVLSSRTACVCTHRKDVRRSFACSMLRAQEIANMSPGRADLSCLSALRSSFLAVYRSETKMKRVPTAT